MSTSLQDQTFRTISNKFPKLFNETVNVSENCDNFITSLKARMIIFVCYNKNFLDEIWEFAKTMTFKNLVNMKNQVICTDWNLYSRHYWIRRRLFYIQFRFCKRVKIIRSRREIWICFDNRQMLFLNER